MTPEEELHRAERARQILEDPLVKEALKEIRDAIVEQWRTAPVKDSELKEKLWSIFGATHKFEQLLRSHIETGKMAAIQEDRKGMFDWLR